MPHWIITGWKTVTGPKFCSADEACKCFPAGSARPWGCSSIHNNHCEKDSDCQKYIKSCTNDKPCICRSKELVKYGWFKRSGICVRKSDGCRPGFELKTCKNPIAPPEFVCHQTPYKPRDSDCKGVKPTEK